MEIKSDIEIAQSCEMKNIREIAATAGVDEKYLDPSCGILRRRRACTPYF